MYRHMTYEFGSISESPGGLYRLGLLGTRRVTQCLLGVLVCKRHCVLSGNYQQHGSGGGVQGLISLIYRIAWWAL